MTEVDVVVIGAGAAGLAAGRALERAGVTFKVLEAKDRIGGRAFTDTTTFGGLPFDRGCHWLHSASLNPLRAAADQLGFSYRAQPGWGPRSLAIGGRFADAETMASLDAAYDQFDAAIGALAAQRRDVSAAAALPADAPWRPVISNSFSLASSAIPEETSLLDTAFYRDTEEDYPVEQGLGALVAKLASGLPVTLSTPVSGIDWSGHRVVVKTASGNLSARAVVLTISTTLIGRGAIGIDPILPAAITAAIDDCQLGAAEKVAFLLDAPMAEVETHSFLTAWHPASPERMSAHFYCNQFGQPIVSLYLGGRFAREIEAAGEAAMIDFALSHLSDVLGANFRRRIRKMLTTHWSSDPDVGGAYSVVKPGRAASRLALQTVFSDRLFLAGEATAGEFYSTAHGAHLSGERAARLALEALAGRGIG